MAHLPFVNVLPVNSYSEPASANSSEGTGSGGPLPWTVPEGYQVEVVATGFQLPVNIAFVSEPGPNANDPLFYVTELYGTIKVVTNDGSIGDFATDLLNFNPTGNFPGSGEQGLTGIVVDPLSGDVFASMLYSQVPFDDQSPHFPKVVRFSSADGGLTAASQTTILDMFGESQGQSHQISNLTIGPDSMLYVHNGDGFDASTAQNLNSFRGKVLRMQLDGSPDTNNPFYDDSDGITATDYIFAYGLRNPFGGAWRDLDGAHYEVENGPGIDRLAKVPEGTDLGWNGNNGDIRIGASYVWEPAHAPVNLTFIQNFAFGGSGFPTTLRDHLFVTESGPTYATGPQERGKRIVEFVLDAEGNLMNGPTTFAEYNGTGKATAVGLAAGPDGLYFTDLYKDQDFNSPIDPGANVLRIQYVRDGDMDIDGDVDFDDILPFVLGLSDRESYESMFGVPVTLHGDTDGDGDFDFDDIPGFVEILSNQTLWLKDPLSAPATNRVPEVLKRTANRQQRLGGSMTEPELDTAFFETEIWNPRLGDVSDSISSFNRDPDHLTAVPEFAGENDGY